MLKHSKLHYSRSKYLLFFVELLSAIILYFYELLLVDDLKCLN